MSDLKMFQEVCHAAHVLKVWGWGGRDSLLQAPRVLLSFSIDLQPQHFILPATNTNRIWVGFPL